MAQDMSSQGNSGLSKPGFGAKAPVQENGGFGVTQPAGTNTRTSRNNKQNGTFD